MSAVYVIIALSLLHHLASGGTGMDACAQPKQRTLEAASWMRVLVSRGEGCMTLSSTESGTSKKSSAAKIE